MLKDKIIELYDSHNVAEENRIARLKSQLTALRQKLRVEAISAEEANRFIEFLRVPRKTFKEKREDAQVSWIYFGMFRTAFYHITGKEEGSTDLPNFDEALHRGALLEFMQHFWSN